MASVEFFEDQPAWPAEAESPDSPPDGASDAVASPSVDHSLAGAVDELRVLEDQVSELARDARRTLRALTTQRLLRATGFGSREVLEDRLMTAAPRLALVLACAASRRRGAPKPVRPGRHGGA